MNTAIIFNGEASFLDLCREDFYLIYHLGVVHIFILHVQIICSRRLYIPDEFEPFIYSRCVSVCVCVLVCVSTTVCVGPGDGRS